MYQKRVLPQLGQKWRSWSWFCVGWWNEYTLVSPESAATAVLSKYAEMPKALPVLRLQFVQ